MNIIDVIEQDLIEPKDLKAGQRYWLSKRVPIEIVLMNKVEGRKSYRFADSSGKKYIIKERDIDFYLATSEIYALARFYVQATDNLLTIKSHLERRFPVYLALQ